ncbi:MAG: AAA family ATPase [Bacteroidaceae bacterium]|nr:AAA family ATPase [Bacteroidaceae bacterium]
MLIGRKEEIRKLKDAYASKTSEFIAVYGRRRVGKTFLVREVFDYNFTFQHAGISKKPLKIQLNRFHASLIKQGLTDCPKFADWYEAFDALEVLINQSDSKKKIIFLDEIAWMETPKSNFVSALESFWNSVASNRKDVLLIICASATSWIIKNVLKDRGGLHNRVTKKLPLAPFTLKECEDYAAKQGLKLRRHQILNLYMVMGGVALYWSLLDKSLSVAQNIDALFFGKNPELKGEFNELYDALFKKPEPYKKIIITLSKKMEGMTMTELRKAGKIPDGGVLTGRLRELEECGFIVSSRSFHKAKKDTIYKLIDNYTIFYFKYVRENEKTENFWTKPIDPNSIRSWSGLAFERVCMQHISQLKQAMGMSAVATTEYAWRSDPKKKRTDDEDGAQIDLLIERGDGVINICEMKWSTNEYTLTKQDEKNLSNKVEVFEYQTGTKCSILVTMVTTFGVKHNMYYDSIQSEVTIDQLFI